MCRLILLLLLFSTSTSFVQADTVTLSIDGTLVRANYHLGDYDKPAVLLVHDFLSTKDDPIVRSTADYLRDLGYTVLTPTLSLGVSHREQSLRCDTLHTHSMSSVLHEISTWTRWLVDQEHLSIVVGGVGFGANMALAYLDHNRVLPEVSGGVLINPADTSYIHTSSRYTVATKPFFDTELKIVNLLGCPSYVSDPAAIESYLTWGGSILSKSLRSLSRPAYLLLAIDAPELSPSFQRLLEDSGRPVARIPGVDATYNYGADLEYTRMLVWGIEGVHAGRLQ